MTDREWQIMRLLGQQHPLYAGLIREATGLSESQSWRVLSGLCERGWVRRERGYRGRSMYTLTLQGYDAAIGPRDDSL